MKSNKSKEDFLIFFKELIEENGFEDYYDEFFKPVKEYVDTYFFDDENDKDINDILLLIYQFVKKNKLQSNKNVELLWANYININKLSCTEIYNKLEKLLKDDSLSLYFKLRCINECIFEESDDDR
jgi:site-specific DNA-adenine methylase